MVKKILSGFLTSVVLASSLFFCVRADAAGERVSLTTDKIEYEKGEMVKVTLVNYLEESIYSQIASNTPSFFILYVERKKRNSTWEQLFANCQYPNCVYDIDGPAEIKPGQSASFNWKPFIFLNGTANSLPAESGTYRLIGSYHRKRLSSEGSDLYNIRSNEFKIK